jgi:hypothetical protein
MHNRNKRYNKRLPNGRVDFRRIFGLEGIYVANRYTNESAKVAQTVISYNKGIPFPFPFPFPFHFVIIS